MASNKQGLNGAVTGTTSIRQAILSTDPLFTNLPALQYGISQLNNPGLVTMIGLYGDSILAGTQASDINTSCITRFRIKALDILNARIGGSAKSGRGRFGPFHHNAAGAVNGVQGPIIIGSGSGWVRGTSYYTSMFWENLSHPGGVTPGAGTSYCGCYMLMSQPGLTGNAARWLGLILNGSSTGTVRVQFRQGASVVPSASTGTGRFTITSGVPDPAANPGDVKLDVTIDCAASTIPDWGIWFTGHLNSTTMDPTNPWVVCLYRTSNAATSVAIHGFDAHYDEYTAQNTPNPLGATVVADFTRPGKTGEIFQSGASVYGTNSDWNAQGVEDLHINAHTKSYNKSAKFNHSMPVLKLAVSNFWRNDLLNVETITNMNPTQFGTRLQTAILAFNKVGVPLVQLTDIGASSSYICAFPYFDGTAQSYIDNANLAVNTCSTLAMTAGTAGGGTNFRVDLACGTGGPKSYASRDFYSTGDYLHLNDAGQEWMSTILAQLVTTPENIEPFNVFTSTNTTTYESRTLTNRLGITKTTLLELDPDKFGCIRLQAGGGFYPAKKQHSDFGSLLHGIGAVSFDGNNTGPLLGQTKRGANNTIIYNMDQFGKRAGLQFDNEALGLTKIEFDISGLGISETQATIFFIVQNERTTNLYSWATTQQFYWMFGNASDVTANTTSIFDTVSNHAIRCGVYNGNSGQLVTRVGSALAYFGDNIDNPGMVPARHALLGCLTFDTTTGAIRTILNPRELSVSGWNSYTTNNTLNNPWTPTRLSIGGLLGTGNTSAACAFGGLWVIRGIVTDAEYLKIWNQLYAESGGYFETGYDYSNYGEAGGSRA